MNNFASGTSAVIRAACKGNRVGGKRQGVPYAAASSATKSGLCRHGNRVCLARKQCESDDTVERKRFFGYWTWRCYAQAKEHQADIYPSSGDEYTPGSPRYVCSSPVAARPSPPSSVGTSEYLGMSCPVVSVVPQGQRKKLRRRRRDKRSSQSGSSRSGSEDGTPVDGVTSDRSRALTDLLTESVHRLGLGDSVDGVIDTLLKSDLLSAGLETTVSAGGPEGPKSANGKSPFVRTEEVMVKYAGRVHKSARALATVDAELLGTLRLEALYCVRTPELQMVLKRKGVKYLSQYDTSDIPAQEVTSMIHRAVVAAMLPDQEELDARHTYRMGAKDMHQHAKLLSGDLRPNSIIERVGDIAKWRPAAMPQQP